MRYFGAVIRPPSESSSLIVQVTYGCSNNSCDFCCTYLDKPFAVRSFDEVVEDVTGLPDSIRQRVRRVFLADGDALALSRRRL
ncbi:MAG TPA: radical SAM protein, partial [Thermoleophilia bacterium]|nr:radical SAM protein [Thermoleophilia bacterium]